MIVEALLASCSGVRHQPLVVLAIVCSQVRRIRAVIADVTEGYAS